MLIIFATWLSSLFVFCQRTTCVFSFSPFCTRSSNSNTFVASFLKPITFCGQLALSVFIVCTSQCLDLLSKYFNWRSVGLWWIQAFLLIGVTARIMSFWQTALLTLERCEENCVTGADEPRKRAFISQFFPRQPFVGRRRCDARIRFPNLNAFSVCTSQTVILWLEETFSPRLCCVEGPIIVLPAWLTGRQLLKMEKCVEESKDKCGVYALQSSPLRCWSIWQRDRYRRGGDKCGLGLVSPLGKMQHISVSKSLIKPILQISSLAPNIAQNLTEEFD